MSVRFITLPLFDAMELANQTLDGKSNLFESDGLVTINLDQVQSFRKGRSYDEECARDLTFRPTWILMQDNQVKVAIDYLALADALQNDRNRTEKLEWLERHLIQPEGLDILKARDAQMPLDLDF
jgi:hypothetical protein